MKKFAIFHTTVETGDRFMLLGNSGFSGERSARRGPALAACIGFSIALLAPASGLLAHGVDYRIERGQAVMVHFSSQHDGPMAGAGYRVFSPDGKRVFARGHTDALGRAVFVPDRAGDWRMLMATEDGHGAEVGIVVDGDEPGPGGRTPSAAIGDAGPGRLSTTAAGIGYLFGLCGLLALWRLRR